jgi:hypothetical protein
MHKVLHNDKEMNLILIFRILLPDTNKRHVYLREGKKFDYLGQIISQLEPNLILPEKVRFPSELGRVIHPFTSPCRGSIIDTCITVQILMLDKTRYNHEEKLNELLNPFLYRVMIRDRPSSMEPGF